MARQDGTKIKGPVYMCPYVRPCLPMFGLLVSQCKALCLPMFGLLVSLCKVPALVAVRVGQD